MLSSKKRETTKLFYDEYPYKLVIVNGLSHIFRDKNLSNAKIELDILQQMHEKGQPLVRVSYLKETCIELATFVEAKKLYIQFYKQQDFKIRIQNPKMQIYSHNYAWLEMLSNTIKSTVELWEPISNINLLEKNVILVKTPPEYEYKITLNNGVDPALANWIRNNNGKAKAGELCLETIERKGYTKGFYFYVRDNKVLQLLNLFIGRVQRIDKLLYNRKIDK
jgi:hypothetical protein